MESNRAMAPSGAPRIRGNPLILLVDDCDDNREMYAACLTRRGFDVEEAADGRSALEKAFRLRPDLVVMDLTLPDMDGAEAIRKMKADARTRETPVVVVSGYGIGREMSEPIAPWDAFFVKPCPPDALTDAIRRILR